MTGFSLQMQEYLNVRKRCEELRFTISFIFTVGFTKKKITIHRCFAAASNLSGGTNGAT
jgi:hypothetical protein